MTNFNEFLEKRLNDPNFKKEYDALEPEYAIMKAMLEARIESGMTQKELADRSGITQADISRLENGNGNPSIRTLKRLANAMGKNLKIEFVDSDNKQPA